jgi:hypothetical protein
MSREEMEAHLCNCGWGMEELSDKSDEELDMMCKETGGDTNTIQEKKKEWIKGAIKKPESLRSQLHKKKGEKISDEEINSEISKLKKKDKDKDKPGLQLSDKDQTKHRRLQLAKTLKKM